MATTVSSLSQISAHSRTLPLELPNLPGIRRTPATTRPKGARGRETPSTFRPATTGSALFSSEDIDSYNSMFTAYPVDVGGFNDTQGRYSIVAHTADREHRSLSLPYSPGSELPLFLRHGGVSLNFTGYLVEKTCYDNSEHSRVRKYILSFYPEDDTLEVSEPHDPNSGLLQGKFLLRHQVPKPQPRSQRQQQYYHLEDFEIGAELKFYGRTIKLVDCDEPTRAYLREVYGKEMGFPLEIPGDEYSVSRSRMTPSPTGRSYFAPMSTVGRGITEGFFKYDRQTLCFLCCTDDSEKVYGDALHFRLYYYLADDTMEITPHFVSRDGRDHVQKYLKRCRIPKQGHKTVTVHQVIPEDADESRYWHWEDLAVGKAITILGSTFTLLDADTFTRNFYAENSIELSQPVQATEREFPTVKRSIPPYNGFGSEEDSLQTCTGKLVSCAPHKDGLKAKVYAGVILRYSAKLTFDKAADTSRRFIVQVYLEDDTVQIREPPCRNSGFLGGKFLARTKLATHGKIKHALTDFYVGAALMFCAHEFSITDADEFTLRHMETHSFHWTHSDILLIVPKLQSRLTALKTRLATATSIVSGRIPYHVLEESIHEAQIGLIKQEFLTLVRALDPRHTQTVREGKLMKLLQDPSYRASLRR